MNAPESSYPLTWPVGWPRAKYRSRAKFGGGRGTNWSVAIQLLEHELRLLGASQTRLSTNMPLRLDGLPRGDGNPYDSGAAVYFRLKGEPRVLACDKWDRVADNLMAIAKHIEAVRGQIRWGVGTLEQAFGGYKALPEVGARRQWWEILGVQQGSAFSVIEAKRDELLMRHHPDRGGSHSMAAEINAAFDEARKELAS